MQKTLPTNASMMLFLKTESQFRDILLIVLSVIYFPGLVLAQTHNVGTDKLAAKFNGKYGQVEVGGKYVGAEFHDSRPFPSRISFYYPVANSLDLSTDYWKRGESEPFKLFVGVDGRTDTIGTSPCVYSWTPYEATFTYRENDYKVEITYQFCDDLPFMVVKMAFTNLSGIEKKFNLRTSLSTTLRTCQTYTWKDTAEISYLDDGSVYIADFRYPDTDSASVVVANAGTLKPVRLKNHVSDEIKSGPQADFSYSVSAGPSAKFTVIQLIGSCRIKESRKMAETALRTWKQSVRRNTDRILKYVYKSAGINVPDKNLEHTALWSKAMLATDMHYIDGSIVPMPCPAEYNFFFTHDVLLTDLGAVNYDIARVKHDLMFIRSITRADSILPHAYYWRDDGFKTEFAAADNWNHLWFMIVCGTYLKHSGDIKTLKLLYPILKKSTELTLSNLGAGDLAYSTRPDWWDIGNNYGARSYLTALMIRALREYCYVALTLRRDENFATECVGVSFKLRKSLEERLWNTKAAYLLNTIDTNSIDYHYYAGSLVAVDFGVIDRGKSDSLVRTAEKELLDKKLGMRNAMPDNFDTLASLYQFKEGEAGGPYVYMNGAVWPQTNAWYILALIQLNRVNAAREALDKYLSIGGIERSPNGQPSFYEYRFSDPDSPHYGKIDKPNFLWAGGWYLNSLYRLVGVRENEWNLYLTPHIPDGFESSAYDLTCGGNLISVAWKGKGEFFRRISADGVNIHSAVILGKSRQILVELGKPLSPYLASASCIVDGVDYAAKPGALEIAVKGFTGQSARVKVVSQIPVRKALIGNKDLTSQIVSHNRDGVYSTSLGFVFGKDFEKAHFIF